jgi:uncharacterized membrane protein
LVFRPQPLTPYQHLASVRTAYIKFREVLSESYWFIPGVMALGAILLALVSIYIGRDISADYLGGISWIYTRDPQAARTLLSMVGGSLITVAGVIFSVTLVALTNASSQFGTRILRTFARDTGNKVVLGAFVGTFLFCLLVMRPITGGQNSFVPHLAVLLAIVLAMLCFGLLIYFIHHVIGILQSDNVVSALCHDLKESIRRIYPEELEDKAGPAHAQLPRDFDTRSVPIYTLQTDYIESLDVDALVKVAEKHDLVIRTEKQPGNFVLRNATLARSYPPEPFSDEICEYIASSFKLASRRSYVQDIGFGFEQLVLVAIRAISPAVNNQLLAMTCIDRICEALELLSTRKVPSAYRLDKRGNLRVIAAPVSYRAAVGLGFDLIGESAKSSPCVTVHLLQSIANLLHVATPPELHGALTEMARKVRDRAMQNSDDDIGRQDIENAYSNVLQKTFQPRQAA